MREARPAAANRRAPRTIAGKTPIGSTPARDQAMQQYLSALELLHQRKVEKAKTALERIPLADAPELADRVRMYLSACERELAVHKRAEFGSLGERYDYAISLLNTGYYGEAREELEAILESDPEADFAYYGLAVLECMTGQAEPCLRHLAEAIRLNHQNRTQARSDTDFQDMADDPRFTELLYPEIA